MYFNSLVFIIQVNDFFRVVLPKDNKNCSWACSSVSTASLEIMTKLADDLPSLLHAR